MKMKKIISLILLVLVLIPCFASCSRPPEYSEIEERFQELVLASGEINIIFFGEGLPTYERISDPFSFENTKTVIEETVDEDGKVTQEYYYYYKIPDKNYDRLYAFKKGNTTGKVYTYLYVLSEPEVNKEAFYTNEKKDVYAYVLEDYEYIDPVLYYDSTDPEYYDYVKYDCEYTSIEQIKEAAEKVYSKDYLDAIYEMMFVGSVSDSEYVETATARYIEYADDEGNISLMKANDSKPFIYEIRQYDFSTARIVKPANAEYVNIEIESYLPSKPEGRLTVRLSMILQDGVWMLDSATY